MNQEHDHQASSRYRSDNLRYPHRFLDAGFPPNRLHHIRGHTLLDPLRHLDVLRRADQAQEIPPLFEVGPAVGAFLNVSLELHTFLGSLILGEGIEAYEA